MTIQKLKKETGLKNADIARFFRFKNARSYNTSSAKKRYEAALIAFYKHLKESDNVVMLALKDCSMYDDEQKEIIKSSIRNAEMYAKMTKDEYLKSDDELKKRLEIFAKNGEVFPDDLFRNNMKKENPKTLLSALLDDKDYITELEGLVCFLAQVYEKLKNTYFDSHMRTCSIDNPNRRDLTDAEQSEWQRFSLIQGSKLQNAISHFAQTNKPKPTSIDKTLERFNITINVITGN